MSAAMELKPLELVLCGLVQEIREARALAERLEGVLVALGRYADVDQLVECQAADHLVQRLSGLSNYLECLACGPVQVCLDVSAAADLPLAAQAGRLRGKTPVADDGDAIWLMD